MAIERDINAIKRSKTTQQLKQRLPHITEFDEELVDTLLTKVNKLHMQSLLTPDIFALMVGDKHLYQIFQVRTDQYADINGYISENISVIQDEITTTSASQETQATASGSKDTDTASASQGGVGVATQEPTYIKNVQNIAALVTRLVYQAPISEDDWPIVLTKVVDLTMSAETDTPKALERIFLLSYNGSTVLQAFLNHRAGDIAPDLQHRFLLKCAENEELKVFINGNGGKQYLDFSEFLSFDGYAQDSLAPLIRKEHYDFAIVEDEAQFETYFQQLADKDGTNLDRFGAVKIAQTYTESIYSYDIFDHILGSDLHEHIKTKRINQIIEKFPHLQHRLYMLSSNEDSGSHVDFIRGYTQQDVRLDYMDNLTGTYAKPLPYSLRKQRLEYYKDLLEHSATDLPSDGVTRDDAIAKIYRTNVSMPIEVKKFLLLEDQHFHLGFSDELTDKRPIIADTVATILDEIIDLKDHWNHELGTQKASEGVDTAQEDTNPAVTPAGEGVDAAQEDTHEAAQQYAHTADLTTTSFSAPGEAAAEEVAITPAAPNLTKASSSASLNTQQNADDQAKAGGTIDPHKGSDEPESKQQPNWFVRIWRAILNFFDRLFKPKATHMGKPMGSDNLGQVEDMSKGTAQGDKPRKGESPSPGP